MNAYERLEAEWAEFNELDPKGMVACSSGTAALHLAMQTLRDDREGYLVMPDYTMVACAVAGELTILNPVFVDIRADDLVMDPGEAAGQMELASMGDYQIYGMAVHVYGRKCPMNWIICEDTHQNMKVIEDLAEAHGVCPHPSTDAACWSFYKNKIVAGEEGGAVWFRDPDMATKARSLRSLGFTPEHDYTHIPFGHNYRMSNAHARLVLASLKCVRPNVSRRWTLWDMFNNATPERMRPPTRPNAPWVYDIRLPEGTDRDAVIREMREFDLPVRYGFKPMTKQEQFKGNTPPVTESVWRRVMYVNLEPANTFNGDIANWGKVLKRLEG